MKMSAGKTTLALLIILFGFTKSAKAEIRKEVAAETYSVEFENFQWYKRFYIKLKGYDFLNWEEMLMTVTTEYDTETGSRTITGVSIAHDGDKKFFFLEKSSAAYSGFVDVDGPDAFTDAGIKAFLDIWNYFYDARTEKLEITVEELIKNDDDKNIFRCALQKEISADKIITSTVPPENKKKYSRIEATVLQSEKPMLEKITFQLKGGEMITLTRKPSAPAPEK